MWINNLMSFPIKEGYYICLVDFDGFGNLEQYENQYFNGVDWDVYESCSQHIVYWYASKIEYIEVLKIVDSK